MNHKEKEKEAAQRKCQLLALPNVLMKIMMKQIRTYPLHQHQPKLANEKNKPVRSMRIIARPWRNDFDLLLKILHLIVYNCKMTGFLWLLFSGVARIKLLVGQGKFLVGLRSKLYFIYCKFLSNYAKTFQIGHVLRNVEYINLFICMYYLF